MKLSDPVRSAASLVFPSFVCVEPGSCGIRQNGNAGEFGSGFLQQLQPFASQHRRNGGEPSDVAPRACEAVNQSSRNGSPAPNKMMGMVLVAFLTAKASVVQVVTKYINFVTDQLIS